MTDHRCLRLAACFAYSKARYQDVFNDRDTESAVASHPLHQRLRRPFPGTRQPGATGGEPGAVRTDPLDVAGFGRDAAAERRAELP